jgi:hypothetical protein
MTKDLGHIESLARSYTDTAIKTLAGIMVEPSAPARARIAAAAILLDRGWGKAKEMHEHSGPDSVPIKKSARNRVHGAAGAERVLRGVACRNAVSCS